MQRNLLFMVSMVHDAAMVPLSNASCFQGKQRKQPVHIKGIHRASGFACSLRSETSVSKFMVDREQAQAPFCAEQETQRTNGLFSAQGEVVALVNRAATIVGQRRGGMADGEALVAELMALPPEADSKRVAECL
ncbi:g6035 [Coccomyxa elongata]